LRPRIEAKVKRALKNPLPALKGKYTFVQESIETIQFPTAFDCLITSPPYMNALDYNRDNRLRLWFIGAEDSLIKTESTRKKEHFIELMKVFSKKTNSGLKMGGSCILVVGDHVRRNFNAHPAELTASIIRDCAPSLKLVNVFMDLIPDIRRSRRECKGVKSEVLLVFAKGY